MLDLAQASDSNGSNIAEYVLLYLPITFVGKTRLLRPHSSSLKEREEDELVFNTYHEHLTELGHFLNPSELFSSFASHGISILQTGASNWLIQKEKSPIFWHSMIHFFALGVGLRLYGHHNIDIVKWFQTLQSQQNDIEVDNIDILGRIPRTKQYLAKEDFQDLNIPQLLEAPAPIYSEEKSTYGAKYLEFVGPRQLEIQEREIDAFLLTENDLLVEIEASLISPGKRLSSFFFLFLLSFSFFSRHGTESVQGRV